MAEHGPMAVLTDRAVISIGGGERLRFLDGLLTVSVEDMAPGTLRYGALLTPQGKIIADLMVFAFEDRIALDVPEEAADTLVKRLSLYKLRADVTVARAEEVVVVAAAHPGAPPDPRADGLGVRFIALPDTVGTGDGSAVTAYTARRISAGVPDAGHDFVLGDAFPHDANMDHTGAVDFAKGCYVGQEIVSRMKHRGTARRRTVIVRGEGPLPEPGTPLDVDGRAVGRLGSSVGGEGLAIVRIDRVVDEVSAAGVSLSVSVPPGATFALAAPKAPADA